MTGEYRKAHLFTPSGEDRWFRRGTSADVIPTDAGVLGPLICYDLRFPELSRKYFPRRGVRPLRVGPVAFRPARSHWEILTAARAVENQAYLVAANAVGPSGPFHYSGGSVIVSPGGERLAAVRARKKGSRWRRSIRTVVEEIRRRIPCLVDRNPRAYRKTRPPG